MKTNLALIGFMGAGKSALGQALAHKLQLRFVDTDSSIVRKTGKSINRIFEEDGEAAFRELEMEVVETAAKEQNTVIACGGGVVLNNINVERLKASATIIYLRASSTMVLKRLYAERETRPLLNTPNLDKEVRRLLQIREPLYEAAADFSIDVSETMDRDVAQIMTKVKKYAGIST